MAANRLKKCGVLIISLFVLMTACSSIEEKVDPLELQLDYPKELQAVQELIIQKKTSEAREQVDLYIRKAENIHWYGHAYFLKGYLFELEDENTEAVKNYLSAIEHGSQYESHVEAKALYNLSFVLEKMDEREKLLVTLIDLMKRRTFFHPIVGKVEIPARLAAAYASQGKMKEALTFHREALSFFNELNRRSSFNVDGKNLSKTLYYLGLATFDENEEPFNRLVLKLSVGQKYFLAASESSQSQWSERAKDRLLDRYNKVWGQVLTYEPKGFENDKLAFRKNQQRDQLEMAAEFYDLLHRLQAEELPVANVNLQSKSVIEASEQWIAKVEEFALKLNIGPEMIRDQRIKNKPLARYIEEKSTPAVINKEQSEVAVAPTQDEKSTKPLEASSAEAEKSLPVEPTIGKDPNL